MFEMPDVDVGLLPEWARNHAVRPRPFSVIRVSGAGYTVTHPDGESVYFTDLNEASNSVTRSVLDSSVFEALESMVGLAVFYPAGNGNSYLVMSHTDELDLASLCNEFAEAKQRVIDYEDSPDDFFTAYSFASKHPAFWLVATSHNFVTFTPPTVDVYLEDDHPLVCLEHGETIRDAEVSDPGTHYHDYRLDAEAATFEKAYVEFAKRVHEVFWWDGVQRVNH